MKVTAAIASPQGGPFRIGVVDLDAPRPDEILVRIAAVGLCHTDVVAQEGGFELGVPAVLGHEGAGVVVAVGAAVNSVRPGDRVALSFRSCGECPKCATGHPAYCWRMPELNYIGMRPDGSRALREDGSELASNFFGQSSFASHALAYERNVVKLDDDIPFEIAAPLGCGIQTGAGSVLNVFRPQAGESLLVAGGGAVGLSAVMAARISGCSPIIVVEPHAERRALAREFGATHAIDPAATPDMEAAVRQIVAIGVDYALDTTGRPDILETLVLLLAPQGSLGCVGIVPPGTRMPGDLTRAMTFGHIVRGIIEGDAEPESFIPRLCDYFREGKLPIDRLIRTYPLEQINQAIADQHAGKCVKVVLTLD